MTEFDYRVLASDDVQALNAVLAQCFVTPPEFEGSYMKRVGQANFRSLHQGSQLVGGLATIPMGQWFGGQCVPMTGIASVGIAPEMRGSGAALSLMHHTLQELHDQGIALSTLYAAAQKLYRQVGYEQGGTHCYWKIPTQAIQVRHPQLPIEPIHSATLDDLRSLQTQFAKFNDGHLDRHPGLWQAILHPVEQPVPLAYRIGSESHPEGYLVFQQQRQSDGTSLVLSDWVLLSPKAGQSLWAFLTAHRSQIDRIRWCSGAIDPLTMLLPEQYSVLVGMERWMVRIVDVEQALSQRGYPLDLETELHLNVCDDRFPKNNSAFVLSVAEGQGSVKRGGRGDLLIDIRGLASLYTGLFSPFQLHQLGYAEGKMSAMAIATQLFCSGSPWTPDFF